MTEDEMVGWHHRLDRHEFEQAPEVGEGQGSLACSLGWEDPLEEGMVTHSGILARRIPWTEEPGRLQSMGSQRVRHD